MTPTYAMNLRANWLMTHQHVVQENTSFQHVCGPLVPVKHMEMTKYGWRAS